MQDKPQIMGFILHQKVKILYVQKIKDVVILV